jgi:hypothetical protein
VNGHPNGNHDDMRLCGRPRLRDGQPCGQKLGAMREACPWHEDGATPQTRSMLASSGGGARVLPLETPWPVLDNPRAVRRLLAETLHQVRTGQLSTSIASVTFYGLNVAIKLAELEVSSVISRIERQWARSGR